MSQPLYSFTFTDEEKAELCTIPLHEQPAWIAALANRKRPVNIPAPSVLLK